MPAAARLLPSALDLLAGPSGSTFDSFKPLINCLAIGYLKTESEEDLIDWRRRTTSLAPTTSAGTIRDSTGDRHFDGSRTAAQEPAPSRH